MIDLLPTRTINQLQKYFQRYDRTARENVKIIVTDMNYTYPKLAGTVFPNAIVIIDKFHIINALNRAFNRTRVRLMKGLPTSSREYHALKRYWKLVLKQVQNLDYEIFKKRTNCLFPLTQTDVVDSLLATNSELKSTHTVMNQIRDAIQNKDWNNYNLAFWQDSNCSEEMKSTLEVLEQHHNEIHNTLTHSYSNGPLEGTNNKIKAIKRASFGYKSFWRFRIRVLFALRVHTEKALITK